MESFIAQESSSKYPKMCIFWSDFRDNLTLFTPLSLLFSRVTGQKGFRVLDAMQCYILDIQWCVANPSPELENSGIVDPSLSTRCAKSRDD